MNENELFDDISRTLASPIPRRQVLRLIVGGFAGAALGTGRIKSAWAACPPGRVLCSTGSCCPTIFQCKPISDCCPSSTFACSSGSCCPSV
jgi:hypothetical protein